MTGEYRRSRGRKKIVLPNGDKMFIPVATAISFIDPRSRYQETEYAIDNSAAADRIAHIDDVYPVPVDADGNPTEDVPTQNKANGPLKVERLDTWKILDPRSRYQESHVEFDNKTGGDLIPPSFTQHKKTHTYRYFKDPDNPENGGTWIDVEFIDELSSQDPRTRYQEYVHSLNNPTNEEFRGGDLSGQASEADPDITNGEAEGTEDNPVRLDPFQNIVNFNGNPWFIFNLSLGPTWTARTLHAFTDSVPLDANFYTNYYSASYNTTCSPTGSGSFDDPGGRGLVEWAFSFSAESNSLDPDTFAGSIPGLYGIESLGVLIMGGNIEAATGTGTYADYPGFLDTLTFTLVSLGWAIKTNTETWGGDVALLTRAQIQDEADPGNPGVYHDSIYRNGAVMGTQEVDVSGMTVTINGINYTPRAIQIPAAPNRGHVSVLFKIEGT